MKNFIKGKDKEKVEIKFNDSESKAFERSQNYDNLVKVNISFYLIIGYY
jgi:hypothetical protein